MERIRTVCTRSAADIVAYCAFERQPRVSTYLVEHFARSKRRNAGHAGYMTARKKKTHRVIINVSRKGGCARTGDSYVYARNVVLSNGPGQAQERP